MSEPLEDRRLLALFAHVFDDINPNNSDLDASDPDGASMGRVNGLAAVAGDNDTLYGASEFGGLFKSTDAGLNWDHLDAHLPQMTWDIEVDPSNTNRVYATSFYDGRVNPITGIQVSNDAGATWVHPITSDADPTLEGTPGDNTPQANYSAAALRRTSPAAYGIGIRPDASNNVAIGTNAGLAITNDGGVTWRIIDPQKGTPAPPPAGTSASNIWDVVWQPGGASGILDVVGDTGHHRSTDGGTTWTASGLPGAAIGLSSMSIAASPDESYVLFVVGVDNVLYESDDAGANWTSLGATDPIRGGGRIPFVVSNDKTNDGDANDFDIWTGGVSLYRVSCNTPAVPAMGGATRCPAGANPLPAGWFGGFTRGGLGAATGSHDDLADIVFDSEAAIDAAPALMSSDGGVYFAQTTNANPTSAANLVWEQPDRGPHALWLFGMAGVDEPGADDEDIYIGMQDTGSFAVTTAGQADPNDVADDWHNLDCCDIFDMAADADTVLYTFGSVGMPANNRSFRLFLGDNGLGTGGQVNTYPGNVPAANANAASGGQVTTFQSAESIANYGDDTYAVLTQDDGNFGDGGLHITTNAQANPITWTELVGNTGNEPWNSATPAEVQVAVSGGTPTFFVSVGSGGGYTADQLWSYVGNNPNANAWQRLDTNIDPGDVGGGVSIFAVDPNNPNRLYASYIDPVTGPRMVFSTNGGANWQNDTDLDFLMTAGGAFQMQSQRGPRDFPDSENSGSPNRGIGTMFQPSLLAYDPEDANVIVAGALDAGVFLSTDAGQSWRRVTDPFGAQDDPATTLAGGLPLDDVPHLTRPRFAHFDHDSGDLQLFIGMQGRGVWRITPDFTLPPDLFEEPIPNDTQATATILGSVPEITLTELSIHVPTDVDFYKFTAHSTGKLIANALFDSAAGQLDLRVRDRLGNIIATGIQTNASPGIDIDGVVIPVVSQQEYFIEVFSGVGHTNNYSLEIENFPAPVPIAVTLDPASDTGMMNNDNLTNDTTPTVFVLADLNEFALEGINILDPAEIVAQLAGAAVEVFSGGVSRGFATVVPGSNNTVFSFTYALGNLAEGLNFLTAAVRMFDGQQDAGGNPAPVTARTQFSPPLLLRLDTIAPTVVNPGSIPDMLDASDSGMSRVDNVTNVQAPAFKGVAEANAKVRIFATKQNPAGVAELVGQGLVGSDATDGVIGNGLGAWEVTVEPLREGEFLMQAEYEDGAGNVIRVANTLDIEIDTLEPNTAYLDLVDASDSGRHNFDNVTNDNTPTVTMTTEDPNDFEHIIAENFKYRIFDRLGNGAETLIYDSVADAAVPKVDGLTALEFIQTTLPLLADGVHNLKLEVEDRAGNISHDFLLVVTIDTVAPLTPTLALDPPSDTGVAGQPATIVDRITKNSTPTFVGNAEADSIVRMWADGPPVTSGTITPPSDVFQGLTVAIPLDGNQAFLLPDGNPAGQWNLKGQFDLNDPLQGFPLDGHRQIAATAEDLAGNESPRVPTPNLAGPTTLDIFVDTRGPQLDDIVISTDPAFDLFDVKPDTLTPTPLVNSLDILFVDQPVRVNGVLGFVYPAVNIVLAEQEGNYLVVGDATGVATIVNAQVIDFTVAGDIGRTTVRITFAEPLPDDRFTISVSDRISDDPGNSLDGENQAVGPGGAIFVTGDNNIGGSFAGRFTVDSRPEIGTYSVGTIAIDINGNFHFDPTNVDQTNRDIVFDLGFASDVLFAGNFDVAGVADGFDKLGAYGLVGNDWRWLIDQNNDGVADLNLVQPIPIDGVPIAGNFDGNAANGDEVGIFTSTTWFFDTNANDIIDAAEFAAGLAGNLRGFPIVGDFDGDGLDDIGTWQSNRFFFDLTGALDGSLGVLDAVFDDTIDFGFEGVNERPVAADMDQDGIDDIGLWVPGRSTQLPERAAEWYFLVSDDFLVPVEEEGEVVQNALPKRIPGTVVTLDHPFTPEPFGADIFAQFGDEFAIPMLGNFDPPGTKTNVVGTMGNWLGNLYKDMLGRAYGYDEYTYYAGVLNNGGTHGDVAFGFLYSAEHRGGIIKGYYQKYLSRAADAAGLSYWLDIWAKRGQEVVEASFIGSAEYYAKNGGTDAGWVQGLYNHVMGRAAVQSEIDYWVNVIKTTPRTNVALGFITSDEYRLKMIGGWYQTYLRRNVDQAGALYWLNLLKNGTSQEKIKSGLLASQEYQILQT